MVLSINFLSSLSDLFKTIRLKLMKSSIYKGTKKHNTYLYIENEDDFSRVPDELISVLGELSHVMTIELSLEKKLAQADVIQVISQLQENGFYLQIPQESEKLYLAGMKVKSNPIPSL